MRAGVGVAIPTVLVVAVVTHAFGVVLLIFVGALDDLHRLSLDEASKFFTLVILVIVRVVFNTTLGLLGGRQCFFLFR